MSLLLNVEGPSSTNHEISSLSTGSAFQRFTSLNTAANANVPSSHSIPQSHPVQSYSGSSPNNKFPEPLAREVTSSPTSSTASDSHSPPTLRKKSRARSGEEIDDEEQETSQNEGDNAFTWPTHSVYDEQRQLLGTEDDSSDRVTSDEELSGTDRDGENRKSVWNITKEQLNYYATQFFSMQPNPEGVIPGNQAKEFFEKSNLPIAELRKIWQLSDVTMDGCLSLEEFMTAMHLVVLRRNNITMPDSLPSCLRPAVLQVKLEHRHKKPVNREQKFDEDALGRRRHHKDLYDKSLEETAHQRLIDDSEGGETSKEDALDGPDATSQKPSAPLPSESETGSVLSSPGGRPTPVNFDFHRPDAKNDPHIIQPVAVRLSPESPVVQSSDVDEDESEKQRLHMHRRLHGVGKGDVGYEQLWNAAKDEAEDSSETDESDESEIEARGFGPVSLPSAAHHQPKQPHPLGLSKKEGTPPPPPPRTSRSHARSSSLDLNRYPIIRLNPQQHQPPPPAVPPRFGSAADQHSPLKILPGSRPNLPSMAGSLVGTKDARALQISIHEYRERNSVVARTINELHQEVSDALEERIALEYQLEQLKSFGD